MLFKPELIEKILAGQKTQTRRIVKTNELLVSVIPPGHTFTPEYEAVVTVIPGGFLPHNIANRQRVKWQVGKDYAICPGRGKTGVARIRITDIRKERVRSISIEDALAEGFDSWAAFLEAFKRINPKSTLDTAVWALTFELVTS